MVLSVFPLYLLAVLYSVGDPSYRSMEQPARHCSVCYTVTAACFPAVLKSLADFSIKYWYLKKKICYFIFYLKGKQHFQLISGAIILSDISLRAFLNYICSGFPPFSRWETVHGKKLWYTLCYLHTSEDQFAYVLHS